ncbi:uncharacterized protein LOC120850576 [Ixodes scapularis]|uniref:uncharacterized protein LOC120850576 n=1 Tax=Ixodes scapularis TaxID=6945 RepID=UPI001C38EEBD|nr:uncharacterized protein LOC120850576 [Ixodes scapularis]
MRQFAARLAGYFDRWLEIAGVEKTFESLRDNILVEQFLLTCSGKLTVFLRERDCQRLDDVAAKADLFLEAQVQHSTGKQKREEVTNRQDAGNEDKHARGGLRKSIRCFLCGKIGHKAENCRSNGQAMRSLACWNCGRSGHKAENCKGRQSEKHQASCLYTVPTDNCENADDSYVTLDNGDKIPVVNAVLGRAPKFLSENMSVVEGRLGEHKITVFKGDTGCNTVVVRKELVPQENLTGKSSPVFLLDRTVRYLPEAVTVIQTPYYTGKVTAKCVSNPLYDLILGNIPQMREANDPDPEWEKNNEDNLGDCLDKPKERYETCPNAIGVNVGCRSAMEATKSIDELLDEKPTVAASASEGREAGSPIRKLERPLRVAQVSVTDTTAEELGKQQKEDATLTKCFNDVGKTTKKHNSRTRIQFLLKNDLLYRSVVYSSGRRSEQLVLPKRFRAAAVTMAHDSVMSGHQGAKNTLNLVAEEFFWPCMQSEIKRYVCSCDVCQRTVPKGKVGKAPLGSMPIIDTPFQRVAIDIIGPIVPIASSGNRYILTMVDMATRYPDAVALKSIGSQQVAEALVQMFTRYGVPAEILSDRGTNFTSELMREVSRLLSMKQLLTTPYHLISNGLVERFNGTIKQMLRRMCKERPKDWDRYLPALLFAYREVPQASLRFSPFELLYGRRVRGPLAILKELWSNEALKEDMKTTYGYILELREKLEETCKLAHVRLHEAREKYKKYYDRKSCNRNMKQGDLALILLPTDLNKMIMQWKGPFPVVARKNDVDYELDVGGKKKVFHINMLKRYEEREGSQQGRQHCVMVMDSQEKDEVASELSFEDTEGIPTPSWTKQQGWADVNINEHLESEKRDEVRELIEDFKDKFSNLPGRTSLLTCDLQLTTSRPIHVKQYPLPLSVQETVEQEIDEMLELDVIERCNSSYNAPVVMVAQSKIV